MSPTIHRFFQRALLFAVLAVPGRLQAQTEGAAFLHSGKAVSTTFATDYQCIGINPANLGWSGKYEGKKAAFGLAEATSSLYSNAISKDELKENFLQEIDTEFNLQQKKDAAAAFNGKDLTINLDVRAIGVAVMTKAGGFAYTTTDHLQWWSNFNKETSEILFLGYNAPYFDFVVLTSGDTVASASLTDAQRAQVRTGLASNARNISAIMQGGAITHQWVREHALAWGYKVGTSGNWNFYTGLSARYLQGLGMVEIRSEGGALTAFSSLSPGYEINYGDAALSNPSTVTGDGFKTVGNGFSGDIGFSAELIGKAKFGVAYTNMGSITWNGNVYQAFDGPLYALEEDGFDNYNFFDQAQMMFSDVGVLKWTGLKETKVDMPSQLRTGASFKIKEKTEVGFDVVVPTNDAPGNFEKPMFGVGGEVALAPWFSVNTGVGSGGMYKTTVPFGLNFRAPSGSWEGGFATRDLPSMFTQEPGMISYCFGFLRFRV